MRTVRYPNGWKVSAFQMRKPTTRLRFKPVPYNRGRNSYGCFIFVQQMDAIFSPSEKRTYPLTALISNAYPITADEIRTAILQPAQNCAH